MSATELRLRGVPLAAWERDGLKSALIKAGLAADDVSEPDRLFWRFERSDDDMPVGFGGLEILGNDALLRSVVTLPPLRRCGIGSAIVTALEQEVRLNRCRGVYLKTREAAFFRRLGYAACAEDAVPPPLRSSKQFGLGSTPDMIMMHKRLQ